MPHPSEGPHHAFDRNQPPTQATPITIKVAKQPIPINNSAIQLRQTNISITTAMTNQNDESIMYNQSSPRVPPPQIVNSEQT
jgi:hypothetical protein